MSKIEINLDWQQEQIAKAIVAEVSYRLIEKFETEIRREVQAKVGPIIEAQINAIVESALTQVFTPVDEFGDPKGEPTTVKAILAKKAKTFLEEKVDSSGRTNNTYGAKQPRAEYLLGKLFEEAINHTAKREIEDIAKQAKEKAHVKVAELIVAQIQKG